MASAFLLGFIGFALFGSYVAPTAYNLVQNGGSPVTQRTTLNFTGAGVSCADGSGKTTCTITSGGGATTFTIANASSTGTTTNTLTKLTGAPSTALIAAITDTGGVVGITTSGAGTTGSATITYAGSVSCIFDGATVAGHYVQISAATAGNCADAGATYPTSGQVLGRVLSTNGGTGTYTLDLFPSEIKGASGGGGSPASTVLTPVAYASIPAASIAGRLQLFNDGITPYVARDNGASWDLFLNGSQYATPPVCNTGGFAWVNQGGATCDNTYGFMRIQAPASASENVRMQCASTNSTFTFTGQFDTNHTPSVFTQAGPAIRESGTQKMLVYGLAYITAFQTSLYIDYYTSPTTAVSTPLNVNLTYYSFAYSSKKFYQVTLDSTNVTFFISSDGVYYQQVYQEAKTAHFTTQPDQACWYANSNNNKVAEISVLNSVLQ